jgi:hypothetical protein
MSTTKKHPSADAVVDHATPESIPVRRNDRFKSESADVKTSNAENEREIPTDVMPDWEEL